MKSAPAATLLAVVVSLSAAPPAPQTTSKARPFPPSDLGLIEGPDREQWQKPEQIMDALGIADGSVVADLGAGGGWFASRLAHRVGPNGRVYAEDIQRQMLQALVGRMQRENLSNVVPVLGTASDPQLPRVLDAVLIVGVYHEIDDPIALLRNVIRALKPHGRLGVVDFTPGGGGPGPAPDQRVQPEAVVTAAAAAGFQLIAREAIPPFQFLLVFGKSAAPGSSR